MEKSIDLRFQEAKKKVVDTLNECGLPLTMSKFLLAEVSAAVEANLSMNLKIEKERLESATVSQSEA